MTDQYLSGSTESPILRPYQQEIVSKLCNKRGPRRLVLSSPPGLGKATALAAAVGLLSKGKRKYRCLVVVPAALTLEWKANLERFIDLEVVAVTPQYYRFLQSKTTKDSNIWSAISIAIVPMGFLAVKGRTEEVIAAEWDLVILDESQHYKSFLQEGNSALGLWQSSRVSVAVALTATPSAISWLPSKPRISRVHWNYRLAFPENEIPNRHIHIVRYTSAFELEATNRILKLVEQISPKTKRTTASKQRAKWMWALTLLDRLRSSAYAFDQTLRRLIAYKDEPDLLTQKSISPDNRDDNIWFSNISLVGIASSNSTLKAFQKMVALLEEEEKDNKWECCERLINSQSFGKAASAILLTEYSDTAEYVGYLASNLDLNACLITRKNSPSEQNRILDNARRAPTLLIGTSGIVGLNLNFTNHLIHYDMPHSPEALLQRFMAIQKIGSRLNNYEHYFLVGQLKGDNERLSELLKGVQKLESE